MTGRYSLDEVRASLVTPSMIAERLELRSVARWSDWQAPYPNCPEPFLPGTAARGDRGANHAWYWWPDVEAFTQRHGLPKPSPAPPRWQRGDCDTYARALVQAYPHLRFGVAANEVEDVLHFYAHDDTTAYDSLGPHPLPYLGAVGQFHHAITDIRPDDWGLDGPADDDTMRKAAAHIRRHQTGPQRKKG